jgi:hypothetical protein
MQLFLVFSSTIAAEKSIHFKKAELADGPSILKLINEQAYVDNDKIVVLPKIYREGALEKSIQEKRLYYAENNQSNEIVAFKKLFIITSLNEYKEITHHELRCCGHKKRFVSASCEQHDIPEFLFQNTIPIYFGGDYTAPDHRSKGVNSQLTHHAFKDIALLVATMLQKQKYEYIGLFYGLTKANAGQGTNTIDRTPHIQKAFKNFLENILVTKPENILHMRYEAFMPTFDPEDAQCIPLPDDKAISGYGNVLLFSLKALHSPKETL